MIVHRHNLIFFIYSQIRKSGILDPVVINAEDKDTVVLSAFVIHNTDGMLAVKRKKDIINCRGLCREDIAEIIVPLLFLAVTQHLDSMVTERSPFMTKSPNRRRPAVFCNRLGNSSQ